MEGQLLLQLFSDIGPMGALVFVLWSTARENTSELRRLSERIDSLLESVWKNQTL